MRDDLFSVPIRKYHIDENDRFLELVDSLYKDNKFKVDSPFIFGVDKVPPDVTQIYGDKLEEFLTDIGLYDTHVILITSFIVKVLEPGESIDRTDTLPSHYTATHYIEVPPGSSSDVFHHPAKALVSAFAPAALDEWQPAAGVYVNQGDVIIHPSFMEHSTPVTSGKRVTMTTTFVLERNEQGRESNTEKSAA
tara:strand:+ start:855 stop:1433 length:579 start_codon:yes stop_codon:yes gene_type:complete